MAQTIKDFFDVVGNGTEPGFRAEPWYTPHGDCIHFHWLPDEFYADRVDDKLTVYRSIATNDPVGCQIKGITALMAKLGDFGIFLKEQDGTPLAMFIFASCFSADDSVRDAAKRDQIYRYILEHIGSKMVEIPASTKPKK